MKTLKAGDVRKDGDEVRHLGLGKTRRDPAKDGNYLLTPTFSGPWEAVSLIGHKILSADLMIAEFRRK